MKILGCTPDQLIEIVEGGIRALVEKCDVAREYGYFSVFDTISNSPILIAKIGFPPIEKNAKYLVLSEEKAQRLSMHPEHVLSWQSRNEAEGKWGGAVRVSPSTIFSFSGLPELADEALMLFVAVRIVEMRVHEAIRCTQISNNVYADKIL